MAAFDFGEKVDPELFAKQLHSACSINIQDYVLQGWEMFKQNIAEFTGFTLIIFAVSAVCSVFYSVSPLVFSAIGAALSAGYSIAAFRLLMGQPIQFNDFFRGFNYFLPLFLASLATSILVSIGLVLFLLPGIYLAVGYLFTTFLVIDYRMEFWQAMETSRKLITRNWFALFGFALVLLVLNILGALALGFGLLISIPVTSCAVAIAYKEIVGFHSLEW